LAQVWWLDSPRFLNRPVRAGILFMRFRRPTPLEDEEDDAAVAAPIPIRAMGLPEKNTFIQFPHERVTIAPVGAFTTPANLAPTLRAPIIASPMLSPSPMRAMSPVLSPSMSPIRTPSTMCGSPVPGPPGFLRCVSDPTGGDLHGAHPGWLHVGPLAPPPALGSPVFNAGSFPPPGAYDPGAVALAPPVSPPVSQPVPLAPLAPLAPRPVGPRPYLLPAPTLPQPTQYAPVAPRVMKFSYTVPGSLPPAPPVATPK